MTEQLKREPGRPTMKAVAQEAGVSTATVSYVLSGRAGGGPGVSEATVQRVRDAVERLGYRPNASARAVRTGRTGLIHLSLHMLSDPWSLAVAAAVNEAANEHGLTTMILADGDWYTALNAQRADVAYIDGLGGDRADAERKLSELVESGQRLVVFDERLEPNGFDVIRSDAIPGSRLAVEHLLERHTDIACLTTRTAYASTGESRYTVYRDALRQRGLPVREDRVAFFEDTQASAFTAAIELLSGYDRPTAIYATTDFAAIAVVNAAHRLGLRVPDAVSVIGVGNTPDARLVEPALSTVGPPDFYRKQARIIVDRALGRPARDDHGELHVFDWSLVVRESTAG
ncbi:LacI family DNA-binding transcriptional regulator [Leifsonia sp. ZF2019]|uniref:LacI family DNA-binding transcriptional regulator n=1 Tax=Leifsonia sp. ZF2019 TaxID=2781978 RepID=UPI001CBE1BC6|nr:LacI family DNA-binding transcriptional regulator [Leifsonia sp. ZF2019]UAJ79207.1 LacI family DNA-binding transcriptional regulator [Leifsonia sp. ZF2019]